MPASVPVDLRQLYKCGWSVAVGSADKRRFCCCCQETCCKAAQLWTAEAINSSVCLSHRQHPPHYPCDNSSTEQNITASWHTVPHFKESKPYQFISAEFSHTDSLRGKTKQEQMDGPFWHDQRSEQDVFKEWCKFPGLHNNNCVSHESAATVTTAVQL